MVKNSFWDPSDYNWWTIWSGLLADLVYQGDQRAPRGLLTRELLGVTIRVKNGLDNILNHQLRKLNYQFMVAEWLWIMKGSNELALIEQYMPKLIEFSDDGKVLAGAYGPRLMPQLPWIVNKLKEPDTRQAVAVIWTPTPEPSKDIPCTVALQFLRRDNFINLIVTMRSSDIWLGLPYDFFTFSQILSCVCGTLACEVGSVQFNLGSSHLYESDLPKAEKILDEMGYGRSFVSERCPGMPPKELLDLLPYANNDCVRVQLEDPWFHYGKILTTGKDRLSAITH